MRVGKCLETTYKVERDVRAGRCKEGETIAIAGAVEGVNCQGEGGGEIWRLVGERIIHLYLFIVHGSAYTTQVIDSIEFKGAIVKGRITFIEHIVCIWVKGRGDEKDGDYKC